MKNIQKDDKGKDKLYGKVVLLIFFLCIIAMLTMVFFCLIFKSPGAIGYGLGDFSTIDGEWTDEYGGTFNFPKIDQYFKGKEYASCYYTIPDSMEHEATLVLRSKNSYIKIFLDGDKKYETEIVEAPFYNHSPGTRWNAITLYPEDAGKTVELRIKRAYVDGRSKVDNFYLGDRAAIIISIINSKIFGIIVCILTLFVGILYIVANVVFNWRRKSRNNSLMYLSIFAIIAAIWGLLESNVFQFFSNNLRLIQLLDNMMLVLGGMALFIYMNSIYGIFKYKIIKILCGVNISYIVVATLFQLMNLWDYHETLPVAVADYIIVVIVLILCVAKEGIDHKEKYKINQGDSIDYFMQQIGIALMGTCIGTDVIRYLFMDVMDRALFTRIGLLAFIICFGAGNIYRLIILVKQGLQAEIIGKLAYSDGLTDLANRTAYMEKLQDIMEKNSGNLGIVMIDINNLKHVNDNLGHQMGDELIRIAANIIRNTFGVIGNTYRIGGDEFTVLIEGEAPEDKYNEIVLQFIRSMDDQNRKKEYPFQVSMAHGVSFCKEISKEGIAVAEEDADRNMYRNKYEMKRRKHSV